MLDILVVGLIICGALFYGFWQFLQKSNDARNEGKNEANYKKFDEHATRGSQSTTANKKQSQAVSNQAKASNGRYTKRSNLKKRSDKTNYSHNWLLTTLKGHTGSVLDMSFSSNGKYLATCADDRTILIWYLKDLSNAKDRKTFRINVEFDHVYKLTWSPDSKAILGFKAMENAIEAFRVEKKDGMFTSYAKSITFPRAHGNDDIINLDIACSGKFIMSASNTTELIIWDVRGNILNRIDTFLMNNYSAKISPCGRFIATSGFAPDIKLWEVKFNKTGGGYDKTVSAFDLTGHNSGVWDFAFDQDGSHVVSVCKDGTFKLFDIKINHVIGESPRCILNGRYENKAVAPLVALSNSAHAIAIAVGNDVHIFSGIDGSLDITIEGIFNENIVAIGFDSLGYQLFVAGDRQVRIFHNITGYKVAVADAKTKLKASKISSATQERLEAQIEEFEAIIEKHTI